MTNPPVSPDDNIVEQLPEETKVEGVYRRHIILLVLLSLVVIVVGAYLLFNKKAQVVNEAKTKVEALSPTPTSPAVESKGIRIPFDYIDRNTHQKGDYDDKKTLSFLDSKGIDPYTFAYNKQTESLAIINQKPYLFEEQSSEELGFEVYVLDLKTMSLKKVFELEPIPRPTEFPLGGITLASRVYSLDDIGFSRDGSLLAITTPNVIYVYSLKTNEITKRIQVEIDPKANEHTFDSPLFSTDNTKIALNRSVWEGGDQMVLDLQSSKMSKLDFRIIAWLDNNHVILDRTWWIGMGEQTGADKESIDNFDLSTGQSTKLAETSIGFDHYFILYSNQKLIYLEGYSPPSSLIYYDMIAKTKKELATVSIDGSWRNFKYYFSDDYKTLFVESTVYLKGTKKFTFDLTKDSLEIPTIQ